MIGKLKELIKAQDEILGSTREERTLDNPDDFLVSLVKKKLDALLLPSILSTPSERYCCHGQGIHRHHLWNLFVDSFYAGEDVAGGNIW